MFQFAWPWMLLVLPLPWVVVRLLPSAPPATGGAVFVPVFATMNAEPADSAVQRTRAPRAMWVALVCWILLVFAAARPQWLGDAIEVPETGRNLLLAVDVSGSMEASDLGEGDATRLDVVKKVAGEFIQRREGDRIGLILFGSQAYLQTPLTLDRSTVAKLLAEAVVGIAGRETAIGDAIGMGPQTRPCGRGRRGALIADGRLQHGGQCTTCQGGRAGRPTRP